jgi:hypothetical protein
LRSLQRGKTKTMEQRSPDQASSVQILNYVKHTLSFLLTQKREKWVLENLMNARHIRGFIWLAGWLVGCSSPHQLKKKVKWLLTRDIMEGI